MTKSPRVALIILDGFGVSAYEQGNAVVAAKLPFLRGLLAAHPATTLAASGNEVGLEWGEVGNSEVGHFNIGAGRVVLQDLPRIDAAIASGRFFKNAALLGAANHVRERGTLHLIGLASSGGVHGHIEHLVALLRFAKQQRLKRVVVHAITDGRDTQPKVAKQFIQSLTDACEQEKIGSIGTVVGRFYAMDRDHRWERIERAYQALTKRTGTQATDFTAAIDASYRAGQTDETLEPLVNPAVAGIGSGDAIICTNYRADRARELMQALTDPSFTGFRRGTKLVNVQFVSFTNYGQEATGQVKVAFFAEPIPNFLGAELAHARIHQLHVAETEKYAHVTYFLNAGREAPLSGEERVLVPSPKIASYDRSPGMAAAHSTTEFVKRFVSPVRFGVVNFANPDMVGHTGNLPATVEALELVDRCLERIVPPLLDDGVSVVITADHGNCEQMVHPKTGDIDKEHTVNPVPCLIVRASDARPRRQTFESLAEGPPSGVLADVAPTVLTLLGLPVPTEMTGQSLVDVI